MKRVDGRQADELRPVRIVTGVQKDPAGSVQIAFGQTVVLVAASVSEQLPDWLRRQNHSQGWITAEYAMMPGATPERGSRRAGGRAKEIQRLIGRSLRAAADLTTLGERTITVDCDVLQADGGTRTAAITGGYVALELAVRKLIATGTLETAPLLRPVCGVSCGLVDGEVVLDPDYAEDSRAGVDMNFVLTDGGAFVELQGTAEGTPFEQSVLERMIAMARGGAERLFAAQREVLGPGR